MYLCIIYKYIFRFSAAVGKPGQAREARAAVRSAISTINPVVYSLFVFCYHCALISNSGFSIIFFFSESHPSLRLSIMKISLPKMHHIWKIIRNENYYYFLAMISLLVFIKFSLHVYKKNKKNFLITCGCSSSTSGPLPEAGKLRVLRSSLAIPNSALFWIEI